MEKDGTRWNKRNTKRKRKKDDTLRRKYK